MLITGYFLFLCSVGVGFNAELKLLRVYSVV